MPFAASDLCRPTVCHKRANTTANLSTNMMDFRGFDASIIFKFEGWNSHVHRGFPGKFEPSNLSRDNVSSEIGRTACCKEANTSCSLLLGGQYRLLVALH